MQLSRTKTERPISSKDRNTGDTMEEIWMETILRRYPKDSLEFLIILMQLWFGEEMERSTSTKDPNSGDMIHSRGHQLKPHILNQFRTGKVFQTTSMQLCNTQMVTHISSREINTTGLMTGLSL